jgi:ribonuclease HII
MALWREGFSAVVGLDEVGRGALAGPVAAGAVILPPRRRFAWLPDLRDSKQLTPIQRRALAPCITQAALAWGIGWADAHEVDALGILPATRLAMRRALAACGTTPDYALVDGRDRHDFGLPYRALVAGDERVASIAAASVIAKVFRDEWMGDLDVLHHGYRFAANKGYASSAHRDALRRIGPCDHHRFSYEPVRAADEGGRHRCRSSRSAIVKMVPARS